MRYFSKSTNPIPPTPLIVCPLISEFASCQHGRLKPRRPCCTTRASQASKPLITKNITRIYPTNEKIRHTTIGWFLALYKPAAVSQSSQTQLRWKSRPGSGRIGQMSATPGGRWTSMPRSHRGCRRRTGDAVFEKRKCFWSGESHSDDGRSSHGLTLPYI